MPHSSTNDEFDLDTLGIGVCGIPTIYHQLIRWIETSHAQVVVGEFQSCWLLLYIVLWPPTSGRQRSNMVK